MANRLTEEQVRFIKERYDEMPTVKLCEAFNENFGTCFKKGVFYGFCHELGLKKHNQHHYTEEEELFLKENASRMTRRELQQAFNEKFGTSIKEDAIVMRCWQKGYKPMNDGKFKAGSVPWEKTEGGKEAYLKTLPRAELGKEYTMTGKPYTYVRTERGREPKHRVIYREHFGELSRGEAVIFADGNKDNFSPDNLLKVSNSVMATLHGNHWVGCKAIVEAGILWCELRDLLKAQGVEAYGENDSKNLMLNIATKYE